MHRRVVITGLGLISPLSTSALGTFQGLCNSEIGVRAISEEKYPEFEDLPIKIAGMLPDALDMNKLLQQTGTIKNVINALSLASCKAAFEDSKLEQFNEENNTKMGVIFGSDKSSNYDLQKCVEKVKEGCYKKLDRFLIPKLLISQSVGTIGLGLKIRGYANSISAGLTTGQLAVSDAFRAIRLGYGDIMVAGAAEIDFNPSVMMSFYKAGMLARSNEIDACKPFDITRDGFVYSVGTGALILEDLDHALKRNANIYAEILSSSSCSETNLNTENKGIERAMKQAISKANLNPNDISLVNADAAGYKKWDDWEASAISNLCKNAFITSHKGNLGHMISASGIAQNIITVLCLKEQTIPPIANLMIPVNEDLNYVCVESNKSATNYAISNSYSYEGGSFSSIVYKKYEN